MNYDIINHVFLNQSSFLYSLSHLSLSLFSIIYFYSFKSYWSIAHLGHWLGLYYNVQFLKFFYLVVDLVVFLNLSYTIIICVSWRNPNNIFSFILFNIPVLTKNILHLLSQLFNFSYCLCNLTHYFEFFSCLFDLIVACAIW